MKSGQNIMGTKDEPGVTAEIYGAIVERAQIIWMRTGALGTPSTHGY